MQSASGVGVSPGDHRAGTAMAIQQTDGHMIFIKTEVIPHPLQQEFGIKSILVSGV